MIYLNSSSTTKPDKEVLDDLVESVEAEFGMDSEAYETVAEAAKQIQTWYEVTYDYDADMAAGLVAQTMEIQKKYPMYKEGVVLKMLDESMKIAGTDELMIKQIEQTKNIIENTTTSDFVWQLMNNNLLSTTILPAIIAFFVKRNNK